MFFQMLNSGGGWPWGWGGSPQPHEPEPDQEADAPRTGRPHRNRKQIKARRRAARANR